MSQNKKKFFGKHKDEQEQDLEQTQPLPSMPENTAAMLEALAAADVR